MYSYSPLYEPSGFEILIQFGTVILAIMYIMAAIVAISMFASRAKEKGYPDDDTPKLWLVGFFATPIVSSLYVISLADKKAIKLVSHASSPKAMPPMRSARF